ncbi:MAG: hypothetical protein ACOX68_07725 [Candidatus Limivicinus sp.]|jgi:hypothetical protein
MILFIIKKFIYHLLIGICICVLIFFFSNGGRLYSGWFSALLGACYILAAWLLFLKSRGSDITKVFRRTPTDSVPYYLRGPNKEYSPKLRFNGVKHVIEDDLDGTENDNSSLGLPPAKYFLAKSIAFLSVGIVFIVISLL